MVTCLIIEDNPVNWMIMKNQVSKLGYVTKVCDHGKEGMDYILRHGMPELILLDGFMPEMDGLMFLREFAKLPGSDYPLIVFCSSSMDKPDINTALSIGAHTHFSKPLQPDNWQWIESEIAKRHKKSASV